VSWDRDYFAPTDALERRTTLTWVLIATLVSAFAIETLWAHIFFRLSPLKNALGELLFLTPADVVGRLRVWQLLTHLLFHGNDVLGLALDGITLYFFGRMVEELIGAKKLAVLWLGGGLVTAAVFVALGYLMFPGSRLAGPAGAMIALVVAAGLQWPNLQVIFFIFPMKLKWVVLLYIGFYLYSAIVTLQSAAVGVLAGAVWGLAFWKLHHRVSAALERWDAEAERKAARREVVERREEAEELDRILAKIAREGMSALSSSEKRALDRASRKKRSS
jgi:membrane associated rhomboid family serine protease